MNCTISGSFRKHYENICEAIDAFEKVGITVLSPIKSKIINPDDDFAVLESDGTDDVKSLELQHLEAIRNSDFLYVCNPSGYLGTSTLLEIGFALACGKKLYFAESLADQVINSFADGIGSPHMLMSHHDLPNRA